MAATKKTFEQTAGIIRAARLDEMLYPAIGRTVNTTLAQLAQTFANNYAHENEQFNYQRFIQACGFICTDEGYIIGTSVWE